MTPAPFTPPPLAPRNPMFALAPVEMCPLAGVWTPGPLPPGWDAEEKHDGVRAIWTKGAIYSREGNPLPLDHVAPDLQRLERRFGEPMVFDGEYAEPAGFLATLAAVKHGFKGERRGVFHIFDAVPTVQWRTDTCMDPLSTRRDAIGWALGDWKPAHVERVQATPVSGQGDVEALAATIWARGGEGLILKRRDSLYRRCRTRDWLKLKRALALRGAIVEMIGERAARVAIDGRVYRVAVPASFTPIVGMRVDVAAMEYTGTGALRQGRIVGMGKD
ncbi:hypothetical protein [Sphingomonas sp.]|uniref:ATP-dependent DNA ligase n=1 Tax=Sphingomonas sp. TaxID=28214 RepID=UPI0035A8F0DE